DGSVELKSVVADAVRMARGLAATREVTFEEPSAGSTEILVRGGRNDLSRALRNLLDNAVTHSPRGGTVRIARAPGPDRRDGGGAVDIAVEDEGAGVDEQDLERIFTPFWRGSAEEADTTGAGLGLAIARDIARRNGGDIVLDKSGGAAEVERAR